MIILFAAGGRDFGVPTRAAKISGQDPAIQRERIRKQRTAFFRAINVIDEHGEVFVPGKHEPGVACIDLVVQGGARGADALAKEWAEHYGRKCDTYDADWNKFGTSAGPIRNEQMRDVLVQARADGHVIVALLAPGGSGTNHMRRILIDAGFTVHGIDIDVGCACHPKAIPCST